MSWSRRVVAEFRLGESVAEAIEALFERQRANWPLLAANEAALERTQVRELSHGADRIAAQRNPGRRGSVSAKVDPASVRRRPCFLCEPNLPVEERGIAFGPELVLLPNPFPIVPRHISVATREHVPQAIEGRLGLLLALAGAVDEETFVIYNGPRCGASAPDHFHFQTGRIVAPPIEEALPRGRRAGPWTAIESFGRQAVVLCEIDAAAAEQRLSAAISELATIMGEDREPMLNLLARHRGGELEVFFFPRARHRPGCYFEQGEQRFLISPGAMEMAGILVLPEEHDFARIDADRACSVYREVSLDEERFERWWERLQ